MASNSTRYASGTEEYSSGIISSKNTSGIKDANGVVQCSGNTADCVQSVGVTLKATMDTATAQSYEQKAAVVFTGNHSDNAGGAGAPTPSCSLHPTTPLAQGEHAGSPGCLLLQVRRFKRSSGIGGIRKADTDHQAVADFHQQCARPECVHDLKRQTDSVFLRGHQHGEL